MLRPLLLLASALLFVACSPALDPPMTRSCRGEYVNECRPYTYATLTSASLSPERVTLNDPTMRVRLQAAFTRCAGSTMPVSIQISAFVGAAGDGSIAAPIDGGGGTNARVIPLTTIPVTDTSAGSVDVMIDNPFFANVPANTQITLQFATIIDGCEGQLLETPYRTGGVATGP